MDNSKVSIVIPVYNVSAYLSQCLDSVVNQTYKDIEIICVDDGSTDGSGKICDEYAAKDQRVQVIHKPNGGVSSARNAGLKAAEGEYIAFIDSDDYVNQDYIQTLCQGATGVDAAGCGWRSVQNGVELNAIGFEDHTYSPNQKIKEAYQRHEDVYRVFRAPWGKMYRRETIGNLKFDENLLLGEDIVFNLYFLQRANAVRVISYSGYNVRKRFDSIMHQSALRYSVTSEHGYTAYYDARTAAQLNWGFDADSIYEGMKKLNAAHYYSQVMNLVSPGTPYNNKQIREKIREIHQDKEFIQPILERKYSDLSLKEKIAKLNVQLNMPALTAVMFYCIKRTYGVLIKSAALRKLGRKMR